MECVLSTRRMAQSADALVTLDEEARAAYIKIRGLMEKAFTRSQKPTVMLMVTSVFTFLNGVGWQFQSMCTATRSCTEPPILI